MTKGRLFDGRSSRGQEVLVSPLAGGLRLDGAEGEPPVFWAWSELPRSCLTTTGTKTLVVRGLQTLEVDDPAFRAALRKAQPRADLFRSPFHTWIATPGRFALTLGVAAGALALAFLVVVPWAGDLVAASLPPPLEQAAGEALFERMTQGKAPLPEATEKLQVFWDELELPTTLETRLAVIDDPGTANAYALLGGRVVVYRDLIEACRTSDELAGVLAHEAAHGELRHSARLIGRSMAGAFLLSYLLSDPTGITGAVLGNVDTLRNLQFSREMEADADAWAARNLAGKADIRGLGDLLERIETVKLPGWAAFLGNHPPTPDRVRSFDGTPAAATASEALTEAFEDLKASLQE